MTKAFRLIANVVVSLLVLTACQSMRGNRPVDRAVDQTIATGKVDQAAAFTTTSPKVTGAINHPELSEVSGLAASTRRNNTLWAINDSGNKPKLYALQHTGQSLASFKVGVKNQDWEDLASAWIDGESYLFIADIGDNRQRKDEHTIHIFAEPNLNHPQIEPLLPLHTLRFRYPDGAHDAESMAVADGWIYVLTKESHTNGKRQASQVYRLALNLSDLNNIQVARKIASIAIPAYSIESSLIESLSGLDISQPTAFDIDAQNRYAYLLTYRSVFRYKRESHESWADVLARPRKRIHTHSLSQAEALAVSENGVVWFTSEKRPAPLWALPAGS